MKNVTLQDVIDIAQWQRLQDHFAEVTAIQMRTVDLESNLLTTPSHPPRFCTEITKVSPEAATQCNEKCLPPDLHGLSLKNTWKEGYQCLSGLYNFAIPINIINNRVIAYILVGPVILGQRQKPDYYKQDAEQLGIELDTYFDGLREIKQYSHSGIQAVLELLKDVVSYIAQQGYSKFRLERIISLPQVGKRVHNFYIERLLNALLDVSSDTIGAEFGSIMLLDEKTNELYIKIGRGIKRDIIKSTRLKMGEGLAGLAAQEKRFLLLDDRLSDEQIKSRFKRPQIKSAIVAPIQLRNRVFGIMNLATSKDPNKFSSDNVSLLGQLINLVSVTLQDLAVK